MFYIYIIYSASQDTYYVGHTSDYQQRLLDHNNQDSFSTYTSKHRPWILKAVFECGYSKSVAMQLEWFIKKQKMPEIN